MGEGVSTVPAAVYRSFIFVLVEFSFFHQSHAVYIDSMGFRFCFMFPPQLYIIVYCVVWFVSICFILCSFSSRRLLS